MNYCCDYMNIFINDPRVPIKYIPRLREYYIPSIEFGAETRVIQVVYHCPWCGAKLPESVRDQYFDILESEYHLELNPDMHEQEGFPEEFKTDEWWKKRGL